MSSVKPQNLKAALLKKGFKEAQKNRDHDYFFFYVDGVKTPIRTKMSHGGHGKESLGEPLIQKIKDEMRFETKDQLLKFIECTFSYDDYKDMLNRKGLI